MKKYIALAIGLLTSVGVSAQDCDKQIKKQIINKIKNYKPTDLVPYSENGLKWAFVDVKSKKRITDFVLGYAKTFDPNFRTYLNDCEVNIEPDYSFTTEPAELYAVDIASDDNVSKATKEDLGFDVNEKGEMTAYSKTYKIKEFDSSNISNPILYNEKYYAVLSKENEEVLIDQKGVEQEDFHFKRMFSIKHKNSGEEVFYVEDKQGQKGFITLSGRKILYGELISPAHNSNLGYSIQKKGKSYNNGSITISGVLDLTTQTWLIKPQSEYKIYDILFSSSEKIDSNKAENRDKVQVFFLAIDKNNEKRFVLDKNGTPILPKK